MKGQRLRFFREDDMAPTAVPPVPGTPGQGDTSKQKHSFTSHFQDEFDVSDDTMKAVEPSEVKMALKPFRIPELGFQPAGPIPCIARQRPDGSYDVTLMLSLINKRKSTQQVNGKVYRYEGPMKDVTKVFTKQDLERLRVDGWDENPGGAGGMPGMGPPGMGGPPSMGGPPPPGGPPPMPGGI